MIEIYFDGACGPINPGGKAGYGFAVKEGGKEIYTQFGFIGEGAGMTNNVAEYMALIKALEYLVKNQIHRQRVCAFGDSKMIVMMATKQWGYSKGGGYKPHEQVPHLKPYLESLHVLMDSFPMLEVKWIPREKNRRADILSKKGMKANKDRKPEVPEDLSRRDDNRETYTLFQKVNGGAARLYGAILYAKDIEYPQPMIDRLETILESLERCGNEMVGKEKAEAQRNNEYNQQRISRKL